MWAHQPDRPQLTRSQILSILDALRLLAATLLHPSKALVPSTLLAQLPRFLNMDGSPLISVLNFKMGTLN